MPGETLLSKPALVYQEIELWEPVRNISLVRLLDYTSLQEKASRDYQSDQTELISFLCQLINEQDFPRRKNGEDYLSHPLNVAHYLQRAKADHLTLSAGLLHDFIEDSVDLYKQKYQIGGPDEARILDAFESEITANLEQKLSGFCSQHFFSPENASTIMEIVSNLTRHKRHKYYRSISGIFYEADPKIKERSIQVKLADRMHNILSLGNFLEERKIFECFKNIFILNNVKNYLVQNCLLTKKDVLYSTSENITEKLFHKCCKATFSACLGVYNQGIKQGIESIERDLQLYFENYDLHIHGLWGINEWNHSSEHPSKLFDGMIRKYDAKIHDEPEEFQRKQEMESQFCRELFAKHYFNPQQISAIIHSKDAYAFKAIVSKLLYDDDYLLEGFGCSKLCRRNHQCLKNGSGEAEQGKLKGG